MNVTYFDKLKERLETLLSAAGKVNATIEFQIEMSQHYQDEINRLKDEIQKNFPLAFIANNL